MDLGKCILFRPESISETVSLIVAVVSAVYRVLGTLGSPLATRRRQSKCVNGKDRLFFDSF